MIENTEKIKSTKKPKKYFLLIIFLCLAFIILFILYRSFFYKSAEKQLAAIEASRAIPESENAAVYYNNFLTDSNNVAILDELFNNYAQASYYSPWASDSDPESSAILGKYDQFIKNFTEISKIPEARFSFNFYDFLNNRISSYLRHITFILSWAGANDIGDGRIDDAMNKFISQTMIACHLNQQPMRIYKQVATAIESVGLRNILELTMYDNITREQLTLLDKTVSETQNYTDQDKELEDKVNSLHAARVDPIKDYPFLNRIKVWLTSRLSKRQNEKSWQEYLLQRISIQRAGRIMIALRLYQKQNSKWPETLDEIKSTLPPENFTDAMNNSVFIYKLTSDSFILYSTGPDNIDNNHQKSSDDIIFWSPQTSPYTKNTITDPNE